MIEEGRRRETSGGREVENDEEVEQTRGGRRDGRDEGRDGR